MLEGASARPDGSSNRERAGATPWRETTLNRLRLRWIWIVLVGLLGAVLAVLLSAGPATYEATGVLQISSSTTDSARVKQVAQTVERTATSSRVIDRAASARGTTEAELAPRVTALWQTDTDIVDVTVTGADEDGVVADANAVLRSLDAYYRQQTQDAVSALRQSGNELLNNGELDNPTAEEARRAGVGQALAAQQGEAASSTTAVSALADATSATTVGLSTPVSAVLGLFAGLVLSSAVALLLPFRRRAVRRASDVPLLLPGTSGVDGKGGSAEVAGLFLESDRRDIAVVAMPGAEEAATTFGADLVALLHAHGVTASMTNLLSTDNAAIGVHKRTPETVPRTAAAAPYSDLAAIRVLGHAGRHDTRARLNVATLVMVTGARSESLGLLAGQREVQAVVVTVPRGHSVNKLSGVVAQLRHAAPVVAVVS
ncbi:hypothetical protein SAMN04488570_2235 [Nocardioides scoriae]|uniref:Capsular polysaccharide biosynthesis protein n=2 Tax=Nocardioides scoriae TaxID=642780 RepID=A0A1H1THQ8_9ACTN|nr:hypothetical protein SAMN04488570_2235 [Nocardioides scoriae]